MHASLVMQDKETDSYWSIMTDEAIHGTQEGKKLNKLPTGKKTMWQDWFREHPQTLVWSVEGKEDAEFAYGKYFSSEKGFRGETAQDTRLPDKEPIFTFHLNNIKYAVPFKDIEGGRAYKINGINIFLFRPSGVAVFYSTVAYQSTDRNFLLMDGHWVVEGTECIFDRELAAFIGDETDCSYIMEGFDTFWYIWSLTNPDTKLLTD